MKYRIDSSLGIPSYLQLYYLLRDDITHNIYPNGSKLPSKRTLAEECCVSVITVEHAYSILCDEGYAEPVERSGYYVIYKENDFRSSGADVHDSRIHNRQIHTGSTAFPYSVLAKTMRRVLSEYGEEILVRTPPKGAPLLQDTICSYLRRSSGIDVSPEQIIIGAGAEYLYNIIIQLLGRDRVYATENPCYDKIRHVYLSCGIHPEALKLGKDGITSEELNKSAATVLHVTPFHSFPSNVSADASKKNEYIRWAKQRNAIIIEDNYDSELTVSKKPEDALFSIAPEGMVIYLNTFSKTIASSIRAGYMVLSGELLELYNKKLCFYSCTVPAFEQYVIAELINNGDFERHINRIRRERRKHMEKQKEENGHEL